MTRATVSLLLLAALLPASYLARLDIQPAQRAAFLAEALPVYKDFGTSLILPLSEGRLASLQSRSWQVEVLDVDLSPGDYFVIYKVGLGVSSVPARKPELNRQERQGRIPPLQTTDCRLQTRGTAASSLCLGDLVVNSYPGPQIPGRVLWENDRLRLVRLPELSARALKAAGFPIVRLPLAPHSLPASLAPLALSPYSTDTTIERIVSLVSQDSLARTIRDLQDFHTRYSYRLKCESAAYYLRARLTDLGYAVRLDTYYLPDPRTRSFNVEATLDGLAAPESIVIACAHYDSYSTNFDSAPGANDDGSGTAAVIELARVLKQAQFRWSVKFLCFSGEEQWMLGSGHWVDSTAVPGNLIIPGVYNLDMFGYTAYDTNMLTVTRNAASLPLVVLAESANAWYDIGLQVVNLLDEDCAGDNAPFWEHGYQAVFACEDSEWGIWNGSDPYYHTPGDTFGNMRMGQVRRTSQLASACLATLAVPYNPDDIAELPGPGPRQVAPVTVFAHALDLSAQGDVTILDASGRAVETGAGPRVGGELRPGIYFIRAGDAPFRRVVKVR